MSRSRYTRHVRPKFFCGAIGCKNQIREHHFLCHTHWFMITVRMRERINTGVPGARQKALDYISQLEAQL